MDARNLPEPVTVPLRTKGKVATNPHVILTWIKDFNPGLKTGH
jgi:hypothetical protein